MTSGISYIGIEVPPYVVTAKTISERENVPEEKISKGLLVNEFRFAGESDTIVTLAANALIRFADNIAQNKLLFEHYKRHRIRAIYFATESSQESSKPTSMLVLEIVEPVLYERMLESEGEAKEAYRMLLEDLRPSDSLETKFACTAFVKTLNLANIAVMAGALEGALVIGSDIALYDSSKAQHAEPTQGAASAIVYITQDPLVARISKNSVHYNLPSNDFYKPDMHTPIVPSGYGSEVDYVLTAGSALEGYESKYGLPKDYYIVSHVPFSKEAVYLASFFYVHLLRKQNKLEEVEKELNAEEPLGGHSSAMELLRKETAKFIEEDGDSTIMDYISSNEKIRKLWDFYKQVRNTKGFAEFTDSIGLWQAIELPRRTGNSYNQSIIVALTSLIANANTKKPIIAVSYGSGAGSTVIELEPLIMGKDAIKSGLIDISSYAKRIELSLGEYALLHDRLISGNEYERGKEAFKQGITLTQRDKEVLKDKFDSSGFKLEKVDERGIGIYSYNSRRIAQKPIII